jgi:hypothetical protein
MSYQIIVARYNEDITWTSHLENVVIYNKGSGDFGIKRKNVGRESETYFYHIINNYHCLPDFLIFVQGNCFEHFHQQSNFEDLLKNLKSITEITPLFTNWCHEPHDAFSLKTKEFIDFLHLSKTEKNIFAPGCQYIVPKHCILKNSKSFYQGIYEMMHKNTIEFQEAHYGNYTASETTLNPWTIERIFTLFF